MIYFTDETQPFIEEDLPFDQAQHISCYSTDEFVVLKQQDGTGECLHVVLLERADVRDLIEFLESL